MDIFIYNKDEFDNIMSSYGLHDENIESREDLVVVSINNYLTTGDQPYFSRDHFNVKRIFFDDVLRDMDTAMGKAKAMSHEQAATLIKFISQHSGNKTYLLHCAAGISRSGAVGVFINDYFGGDYTKLINKNPRIQPNPHVLNLLHRQVKLP